MNIVEIFTTYDPILHRRGLPYRMNGSNFPLKANTVTYRISDSRVFGASAMDKHFRIACKDDPGWLMYILGYYSLDKARHVAANIMSYYHRRGLLTKWITGVDDKFRNDYETNLYILDALFDDDNPYRRSLYYDTLQKMDGPDTSAIVLARSDDPGKFIKYLGLKPHLLVHVK